MAPDDTIIPGTPGAPLPGPGSQFTEDAIGAQVGPYKLISRLGEGGFGSVWLAERRQPFVQRVALKIVKAGMDSKAVVARFEQERQALAVMNHPGIAKVFDGGLTSRGRPYFAMEYVKGEPITEFCDRVKLGIEERLRLFEQACEAVQHAHLKGIVHRDLKPSNVLAFMVEGEGPKLKVIDFGVAKAMSQRMTEQTIFTETGQMIGTPEYMSPEQADPTAGDIDTRSDIYSLGVLLYELLVGATPFDPKELRNKAYGEIQRTLREQDPPSPSARLSTLATKDREALTRIEAARHSRMSDLVRRLRGELEWIPQKAMRKEPQHRYQTAIALAEDVRNYLDGKPLVAAPESTAYRVRKYVRRNRGLVVGIGAVVCALILGLGLAAWQWREADAARDAAVASAAKAVAEKATADAARLDAVEARSVAQVNETIAKESESRASARLERIEDLLVVMSMGSALDSARTPDPRRVQHEVERIRKFGRVLEFPARLALAMSDRSTSGPISAHNRWVQAIAVSPDGRTLVSGGGDGLIRRWELPSMQASHDPISAHTGGVKCVAFSVDGRYLFSGGTDNAVRRWDLSKDQQIGHVILSHKGFHSLSVSRDGSMLATGGDDGFIRLWDLSAGEALGDPIFVSKDEFAHVRFSPDGGTLACAIGKTVRLWDVMKREPLTGPLIGHSDSVCDLAFIADRSRLVSTGNDGIIRFWKVPSGEPDGPPLSGAGSGISCVAVSSDGTSLATGGFDRVIRIWDMATRQQTGDPLHGHSGPINCLVFTSDAHGIVSGSWDGSIRSWDTTCRQHSGQPLDGASGALAGLSFSPDGRTLASGCIDGTIRFWDVVTGEPLGLPMVGHEGPVPTVSFGPDGVMLASGGSDKTVRLWDPWTRQQRGEALVGHDKGVTRVQFAPRGGIVASASDDTTIRLWSVDRGVPQDRVLRGHQGPVKRIRFDRSGEMLASSSYDDTVRLWHVPSGTPQGSPMSGDPQSAWCGMALTLDGKRIASGAGRFSIRLWDVGSVTPIGEPFRMQETVIFDLAFSPDGRTLAGGSTDKMVFLWDVETQQAIGVPLLGHGDRVTAVEFSPDGSCLATADAGGSVRLWYAEPLHTRLSEIRERMRKVGVLRNQLAEQVALVGTSDAGLLEFQRALLADPRFAGGLRVPALILVGELARDEQAGRSKLHRPSIPRP